MDYNDLYVPLGTVGFLNGNHLTLANWQAATTFDSNSVAVDPNFYTANDLHVCNDTLKAAGISLGAAIIATDFDGDPRPMDFPDIGMDQFFLPVSNFLGPDTSICNGDTLWLSAGNVGDTVNWSTGSMDRTISVTAPGLYSVSVSGTCGSGTDDIMVSTFFGTYSDFILADTLGACQGDTLILSTSQTGTYAWSTGATTPDITVTQTGAYVLEVSDNCGTGLDTASVTMINPSGCGFFSSDFQPGWLVHRPVTRWWRHPQSSLGFWRWHSVGYPPGSATCISSKRGLCGYLDRDQ